MERYSLSRQLAFEDDTTKNLFVSASLLCCHPKSSAGTGSSHCSLIWSNKINISKVSLNWRFEMIHCILSKEGLVSISLAGCELMPEGYRWTFCNGNVSDFPILYFVRNTYTRQRPALAQLYCFCCMNRFNYFCTPLNNTLEAGKLVESWTTEVSEILVGYFSSKYSAEFNSNFQLAVIE